MAVLTFIDFFPTIIQVSHSFLDVNSISTVWLNSCSYYFVPRNPMIIKIENLKVKSVLDQRTALRIVVNVCKKLPSECPQNLIEAVPILCNLLQYDDEEV